MKSTQQGFNMIEVLVATVILSVGLLGIAGMQLAGLRANQGSMFMSQATAVTTDMVERIYANRIAATVASPAYVNLDSSTQDCTSTTVAICATEKGAAAVTCTPAQMATYDFFQVACGLPDGTKRVGGITQILPLGRLQVDCLDNAGGVIATAANCSAGFRRRIRVRWTEPNTAESVVDTVIKP